MLNKMLPITMIATLERFATRISRSCRRPTFCPHISIIAIIRVICTIRIRLNYEAKSHDNAYVVITISIAKPAVVSLGIVAAHGPLVKLLVIHLNLVSKSQRSRSGTISFYSLSQEPPKCPSYSLDMASKTKSETLDSLNCWRVQY